MRFRNLNDVRREAHESRQDFESSGDMLELAYALHLQLELFDTSSYLRMRQYRVSSLEEMLDLSLKDESFRQDSDMILDDIVELADEIIDTTSHPGDKIRGLKLKINSFERYDKAYGNVHEQELNDLKKQAIEATLKLKPSYKNDYMNAASMAVDIGDKKTALMIYTMFGRFDKASSLFEDDVGGLVSFYLVNDKLLLGNYHKIIDWMGKKRDRIDENIDAKEAAIIDNNIIDLKMKYASINGDDKKRQKVYESVVGDWNTGLVPKDERYMVAAMESIKLYRKNVLGIGDDIGIIGVSSNISDAFSRQNERMLSDPGYASRIIRGK